MTTSGKSGPNPFNRKLIKQFPRTDTLPLQSSKFWAKEKDRYLRQQLLADLECETGREVIVYYAQLSEAISHADADDLSEIIEGLQSDEIDIILQTPGSGVDAVEKLVTVLKSRLKSYRVIVPSWAKSGGTVIAMSSSQILLGVNSELGPIDPQIHLSNLGAVPCSFVARDETKDPTLRQMCTSHVERMEALAKKILLTGTLSGVEGGKSAATVDAMIEKLSSSDTYKSHGAVIDFEEAREVGLPVEWMPPQDTLWKRIWLLYCCYEHDARLKGLGKIIEGAQNSISRSLPRVG